MSTIANTILKIRKTKLYVPIVTLSNKDNVKLVKLSEEGLEKPVYWNECQTKIKSRNLENSNLTRFLLMLLFKELKDCFFLFLILLMLMFLMIQLTIPTTWS